MDTIYNIAASVAKEDGASMGYFLTSLGAQAALAKVDVSSIKQDPHIQAGLKPVIEAYIHLNRAYAEDASPDEVFTLCDQLMRTLNRFAENKSGWVVRALVYMTKELVRVAVSADQFIKKNPAMLASKAVGDFEHELCLTKAARTIHNAFKLCLNDRNEDPLKSRKQFVYFFVGQELKIYFKLQNRDLAKNMEKVLDKMKMNLPNLYSVDKSDAVVYLYYSGIIYCGEGDFTTAFKKFKMAFQLCERYDALHIEAILLYLIPLKFIVTRKYPNLQYLDQYKTVSLLYSNFIRAVATGDLRKFDEEFQLMEMFFLRRSLYLAMEEMRNFVMLKLIKRVYHANGSNPHLGIKQIARGIEFSMYRTTNPVAAARNVNLYSTDEAECIIANLIYQGHIKGYLSHSNGVLVLSKKEPFPNKVVDDPKL